MKKLSTVKGLNNRMQAIEKYCLDKSVLHLGCVDSGLLDQIIGTDKLLHNRLYKKSKKLVGVDIDKKGLVKMSKYYENLKYGDVETLELGEKYEVIVARELIEHVGNCSQFLQSVSKHLNKDSILI